MKNNILYILLISVLVALMFISELSAPKELNWEPGFEYNSKEPFGAYVFNEILPELFKGQKFEETNLTLYQLFRHNNYIDKNYNLIILNNEFNIDKLSLQSMIRWIEKGNNVFIATANFDDRLFKSELELALMTQYQSTFLGNISRDSLVAGMNFVNPQLKHHEQYYERQSRRPKYISGFDTSKTTILGLLQDDYPNYIKMEIGKGGLYFNSTPYVFGNYNLIDPKCAEYTVKALSYLPDLPVLLDNYYKPGQASQTPLRYILSHPSFRWAVYLGLATLIIFMIFMAKRKQKPIPIIEPLKNSSVEFVKTLSNLYIRQSNHKDMADKKVLYFMDFLRNQLYMDTSRINQDFFSKLSHKTAIPVDDIIKLFNEIKYLQNNHDIKAGKLENINKQINDFYQRIEHVKR